MAKLLTLKLDQIAVPERLRDVDDAHALIIGQAMKTRGQFHPILVRSTPNAGKGKTPWTLVAGAHRLAGARMVGMEEIEALAVEADKDEAALIEIEENLFRNDMSKLERAVFVQSWRDVWERKYGKIQPGNPAYGHNCANLAQLVEDDIGSGFAEHCAERLGLSRRSIYRAGVIAQNLPRELRRKLTGTPIADNQSQLLKLAALDPDGRAKAVKAFDHAQGDFNEMMALIEGRAGDEKKPSDLAHYERLVNAWGRAPEAVRARFCETFSLTRESGDA